MPGAPIRIALAVRSRRESFRCTARKSDTGAAPIDRPNGRADDEAHARADLEQSGLGRGDSRLSADPEPVRRTPDLGRIADRLGGRDHEQPLAVWRKLAHPGEERLLDPPGKRARGRDIEPDRELSSARSPGKLDQRERVTAPSRRRFGRGRDRRGDRR